MTDNHKPFMPPESADNESGSDEIHNADLTLNDDSAELLNSDTDETLAMDLEDIDQGELTIDEAFHQQKTMPVFHEPGIEDPRATLPGTFGLDPNPDFEQPNRDDETVQYHPRVVEASEYTAANPRIVVPAQNTGGNGYNQSVPYGYSSPPPAQPKRIPRRRRRRRLRAGCLFVALGLLFTFCGGMTLMAGVAGAIFIPRVEQEWTARVAAVDDYKSFESTFFYDRNGNLLYEAFGEGRRSVVPYSRLPQQLINATIAIEDDEFWSNIGIDIGATAVAVAQYLGAEPDEQTPGGSTITQQLVRNVLFDFEKRASRSVERKVEEIILAVLLTQRRSKEDILGMYLNEIYYGNLAYGAQSAAQTFFAKDVEDLTLGEAALLAGLPQAPASLDPLNPDPEIQEKVFDRWRLVLDEMVEEGMITSEQRDETLREGLTFVPPQVSLKAPHFTVYAQSEFERLMQELGFNPDEITRGGMKVYTTIDQDVNNLAQDAARRQVASLQDKNVSNAAVLATKPLTGEILAMVGSIDYNNDDIDGRVNVTTAFRQPGSTMKPFTYSAAIERGMTPADIIWDTKTSIEIAGQPTYTPRNYDGTYHGPMTLRRALANSYNIPAVQTLRLVGVDYLLDLMHRFGVESLGDDPGQYGLSLTLGGGEITLVELTNAFSVFANQGSYVPVTSILCIMDSENNIVYQYENSCPEGRMTPDSVDRVGFGKQVLDPRIAFLMTDILSDNAARTPAMGSDSALRTDGIETSVKTGTTNDVKDNWTVGYTRNLAVGVWVGNNDGDPMVNSSGLTGAAPIWNEVFTNIYNNPSMKQTLAVGGQLQPDKPVPPDGLQYQELCNVRLVTDPSPACPGTVNEWMLSGPAGIPDGEGNLQYFPSQNQVVPDPSNGSVLNEISPGIYSTIAYPIPPQVATQIQFQLTPGEAPPPPPRYCRVPLPMAGQAPGAQELVFVAGPSTSQSDAVEAERYAQERGIAYLPTIDCWAEVFNAQQYGPPVTTAVIQSPAPYQQVTSDMPIIGTVNWSPGQVNFYKIEIIGGPFGDWTTIGNTHNNPVTNGQLELLQAEYLPAGAYQIRLVLVDNNSGFLQQPYVVPFTVPG